MSNKATLCTSNFKILIFHRFLLSRSSKKQRLEALGAIIAVMLLSLPVFAESPKSNPWYHIELIVFTQNLTPLAEHPLALSIINRKKPIELLPIASDPLQEQSAFSVLKTNNLLLNNLEETLSHSDHYRILLHLGWHQPIESIRHPRPVHFTGGEALPTNDPDEIKPQVDGLISLKKAAGYISVNLNLVLNNPLDELQLNGADNASSLTIHGIRSLQLLQQQHLRPHDLAYFDHPGFGILLKVLPATANEVIHGST